MKVPLFFLFRHIVLTTVGRIASVGTAMPFVMRGWSVYAKRFRLSRNRPQTWVIGTYSGLGLVSVRSGQAGNLGIY